MALIRRMTTALVSDYPLSKATAHTVKQFPHEEEHRGVGSAAGGCM